MTDIKEYKALEDEEVKGDEDTCESEESDNDRDYERVFTDDWDYVLDPSYKGEFPHLCRANVREELVTLPQGWMRKYEYRKGPTVKKRLDCLFEL